MCLIEDQKKFSLDDALARTIGYIKAFADHRQNKQQIDIRQEKQRSNEGGGVAERLEK